jgi:hypothetical protein
MRLHILFIIQLVYSYIPIPAIKQIEQKLLYNSYKYNNIPKLPIEQYIILSEKYSTKINSICQQLATNNYNPITITDINKNLDKSKWRIIYGSPNREFKVYEIFQNDKVKQIYKKYNPTASNADMCKAEYFIQYFILRLSSKTINYIPIISKEYLYAMANEANEIERNTLWNTKKIKIYYDIIYLTKFIQIRKNHKNEYIVLIKSNI